MRLPNIILGSVKCFLVIIKMVCEQASDPHLNCIFSHNMCEILAIDSDVSNTLATHNARVFRATEFKLRWIKHEADIYRIYCAYITCNKI